MFDELCRWTRLISGVCDENGSNFRHSGVSLGVSSGDLNKYRWREWSDVSRKKSARLLVTWLQLAVIVAWWVRRRHVCSRSAMLCARDPGGTKTTPG